jgi:hypothetical protein
MRLKITLNGFHGFQTHSVRGTMSKQIGGNYGETEGFQIELTKSGAAKFACQISDSKCDESLPESFWVPKNQVSGNEVSVSGNYPQH